MNTRQSVYQHLDINDEFKANDDYSINYTDMDENSGNDGHSDSDSSDDDESKKLYPIEDQMNSD